MQSWGYFYTTFSDILSKKYIFTYNNKNCSACFKHPNSLQSLVVYFYLKISGVSLY